MAMLNWNDYRNQILVRVGEIGKLSPDSVKVKGYMALGGSVFAALRPAAVFVAEHMAACVEQSSLYLNMSLGTR